MKKLIIMLTLGLMTQICHAQDDENFKYMRGSLCIMMVEHPTLEFNDQIEKVFEKVPIPNRFNSHELGVRVLSFPNNDDQLANLKIFSNENQLAKRIVAKWFGRNKNTGAFNIDLLKERGHYSATKIDVKGAMAQQRGMAVLEDLGENLIGHTYWVVNDIQYVNQGNFFKSVKDVANITKEVAGNKTTSLEETLGIDFEDSAVGLLDKVKGFRVKITSHLFRLKWDEETSNTFYSEYYTENPEEDANKVNGFKGDKDLFKMEYVGSVTSTSSKTSVSGVTTNEQMIRKVCTRALDKNIADLQHEFAEFRIKAPLISVEPLKAYVGMKEDINEKSRYEVLEAVPDERGVTTYKRVGLIKPIKGKIWDNRFMADEEKTTEAALDGTYFEIISGKDFYPGMLIRETK
jgi:hypothetical protein